MRKFGIILFSLILVLFTVEVKPSFAAELVGYNYLNNGYIQFTSDYNASGNWSNLPITSVGNAINNYGNLNNPYYFDGTSWRPLTYGRSMEYALSEGGTLISNGDTYSVSGAGTIVYPVNSQELQNFSINGSEIVKNELQTSSGNVTYTGTMSSKGEVLVNNKNLEVKNTYTLLEGKSFVKVKTRITNLDSTQSATNIRYWVGTGDDYIAGDDANHKTRGNIVDGTFVQATSTTDQAKAIRVDSQSFSDSILFYSTHPNANTSIFYCCSFSGVVLTNPFGCATNSEGPTDGSYALFVNLGTILPGAYAEFDWYYAAGSASTILDTISDVALDSSGASEITGNSANLNYTSETLTTGYYMVLARGSTTPSAEQIINNELYTASPIIKSGSSTMLAGVETPFELTGLSPNSDYDVYFVTKNANGETSSVAVTRFSTVAFSIISLTTISSIDFPKNNRVPDIAEIDTVEYTASVSWSPNDPRFNDDEVYVATITITPKDGYTLTGVSANAFTVTGASSTTNSVNSGVITATFPKVLLDQVIFHSNGGTSISQLGVDADALISKPSNPTRLGYNFVGWYEDNTTFENPWLFETETMPLSDIHLYAKWSLKEYAIQYELYNGVNFEYALNAYTIESSTINLGTPIKTGYTFGGWFKNADLSTGGVITSILSGSSGDALFYAKWIVKEYAIVYELNDGIIGEDAPTTFTIESSSVELGIPTKTGYTFEGWYGNIDLSTGGKITSIPSGTSKEFKVYAKWLLKDYLITYQLNGGLNFEDAEISYTIESSTLNLGIPTRAGYIFEGWFENEDLNIGEITSIPLGSMGDIILYAKWSPLPVDVEFDPVYEVELEGAAEAVEFTPQELTQEVSIKLLMLMVERNSLDEAEKALMDKYVADNIQGGVKHLMLFDFSLFKVVGDEETPITSTTSLIKITFLVPEEYRGKDLKIIRIHEGVAELLNSTYDPVNFTLTFSTNKFSTYGMVYGDPVIPNTGENTLEIGMILLSISSLLFLFTKKKKEIIQV